MYTRRTEPSAPCRVAVVAHRRSHVAVVLVVAYPPHLYLPSVLLRPTFARTLMVLGGSRNTAVSGAAAGRFELINPQL